MSSILTSIPIKHESCVSVCVCATFFLATKSPNFKTFCLRASFGPTKSDFLNFNFHWFWGYFLCVFSYSNPKIVCLFPRPSNIIATLKYKEDRFLKFAFFHFFPQHLPQLKTLYTHSRAARKNTQLFCLVIGSKRESPSTIRSIINELTALIDWNTVKMYRRKK